MSLVRWNPWGDLGNLMERYARETGIPAAGGHEAVASGDWAPRVDIAETDQEFTIKAEIPEVKKENVKVTVDNGVLSIKGERNQEKEEKGKKFHRIERHYGTFVRSFTVPENVDESKIAAAFKDGMLTLSLPKAKEVKPKATEVKIS